VLKAAKVCLRLKKQAKTEKVCKSVLFKADKVCKPVLKGGKFYKNMLKAGKV
jgi:hypothetical protein